MGKVERVEAESGQTANDACAAVFAVGGDPDAVVDRFLASGATVALVDGDAATALAAAIALGPVVATRGAALLAVAAPAMADAFYAAGATHFLGAPADDDARAHAIRFAGRHARRARGETRSAGGSMGEAMGGAGAGQGADMTHHWLAMRIAALAPVSAMLVALTRFDLVNAAYGRTAGDALLAEALSRIEQVAGELFGADAVVGRVGGPVFLVACGDADGAADRAVAWLSEALARPFAVAGTLASLGSRIGVAQGQPGDDAAALVRRAGEALVAARASDGATTHVAGPVAGAPLEALAIDLHRAIERDEIDLLFQPQVSLATNRITGVEALARWEHPSLGVLGAETLFAAADRADLGIALSDHIQRLALNRAAAWPPSLGGLRLAINLTAADLARPGFAAQLLDHVDASGFARGRLTLEITESGLIDDLGTAATRLAGLRGAGCRVAVDDFGTGYSSLAYLKALPLDYLKIDKRLVHDIEGSDRDRVVVRGVIEMARSLGLTVVAEGVESEEQRDLLAREGCAIYQGYLCAEPLDVAALVRLVGEW